MRIIVGLALAAGERGMVRVKSQSPRPAKDMVKGKAYPGSKETEVAIDDFVVFR